MYCGRNSRKVSCLHVWQDCLCLTTEDSPKTSSTFPASYGLPANHWFPIHELLWGSKHAKIIEPGVCFIQRGWSLNEVSCPRCGERKILTEYIPSPELLAQELPRPKHGQFYTKSEAAIVVLGAQTAQRKKIKERKD